jgi:hypothetical protein
MATLETVDRRVLGAFICVDAITGLSIVQPLSVSAPPWNIKPNRSGVYVVFDGPGFDILTTQFYPTTPWPAPVGVEVTLQDPNGRYQSRRAKVQAPQSVPAIFTPQSVTLYPQASAPVGPNWCTIRASVTRSGTAPPVGLPYAVLRVVRQSDSTVLATAQTDANGEALIGVIGLTVQANTSSTGPVTVSTVPATVTAYFDPSVLTQPSGWVANPDDILSNVTNAALLQSSQPVQLGSGVETSLSFAIAV